MSSQEPAGEAGEMRALLFLSVLALGICSVRSTSAQSPAPVVVEAATPPTAGPAATTYRRYANCPLDRHRSTAAIRSVGDFQRQVPLRTYDEHQPYIARIAAGETNVLTREPVLMFEPTSGTYLTVMRADLAALRKGLQCR